MCEVTYSSLHHTYSVEFPLLEAGLLQPLLPPRNLGLYFLEFGSNLLLRIDRVMVPLAERAEGGGGEGGRAPTLRSHISCLITIWKI